MSQDGSHLRCRLATKKDVRMIYEWRNIPFIVRMGTTGKSVNWDEHKKWFYDSIDSKDCMFFIIEWNNQEVGQVRFNRIDESRCNVSIYLLPEYMNKGIGFRAIQWASGEVISKMGINEIRALIKEDNVRSIKAFKKAGYVYVRESVYGEFNHHVYRMIAIRE